MTAQALDKLCANSLWPLPTIDGELDSDSGWIQANELTFSNGLAPQNAYARLRMGKAGSNVYLSIRVNRDPTFNPEDVIVFMFGPAAGSPGIYQKLAVFPVDVAGAATSVPGDPPKDVQYWESPTGNSNDWTSTSLPTWLQNNSGNIKVLASSTAVTDKWYQLEMKLPIDSAPANGLVLPAAADFRFYVNTIRWQPDPANPGGSITPEVYWPRSAPLTYGDLNNTPSANYWGLSSLAGPCSGVHVASVRTNNADMHLVNVNSTNNIFTADLKNSGSDPAGRVQAEIRSARFGLQGPGYFKHIPWPGNPMSTSAGINPAQTVSVSTLPWDLTTDPNRQDYITNTDLCSRVELSAISGANTYIADRYFYWNMHFGTASRFSHSAVLDATGYNKRRDGSDVQKFILMVSTSDDLAFDEKTRVQVGRESLRVATTKRDPGLKVLSSLYEDALLVNAAPYIEKSVRLFRKYVCGYRRTGDVITIKGNTAEVVEPANCYGYVIAHNGPLEQWRHSLQGEGVTSLLNESNKPLPYTAYQVEVKNGQNVNLNHQIESVEVIVPPPCKLPTPCCPQTKLSGSMLMVGMVGIGATGFGFKPRRRKEKKEQDKEK
jgi:hypothetical protein